MHKGELRCYHHVIYQVCLACTASAYMTWTFRKLEMAIVRAVSFLHVGEARSCDLCCTLAVWGKVVLLPLVLYLFCARGKLILLMHLFMCVRNLVQLVSSCTWTPAVKEVCTAIAWTVSVLCVREACTSAILAANVVLAPADTTSLALFTSIARPQWSLASFCDGTADSPECKTRFLYRLKAPRGCP